MFAYNTHKKNYTSSARYFLPHLYSQLILVRYRDQWPRDLEISTQGAYFKFRRRPELLFEEGAYNYSKGGAFFLLNFHLTWSLLSAHKHQRKLFIHRRPKLTIRGIDQIFKWYIYAYQVRRDCFKCTVLCYTLGRWEFSLFRHFGGNFSYLLQLSEIEQMDNRNQARWVYFHDSILKSSI